MFSRIRKIFNKRLMRYRENQQLRSHELHRITQEIRYLAEIAAKVNPAQNETMGKLQKITAEMEKLTQLVDSKDFTKIPQKARLELRENLLQSRKKLVDAIHQAPPPTDILQ